MQPAGIQTIRPLAEVLGIARDSPQRALRVDAGHEQAGEGEFLIGAELGERLGQS